MTRQPPNSHDSDEPRVAPGPPDRDAQERAGRLALAGGAMGLVSVLITCGFTLGALALAGTPVLSGAQILITFGLVVVVLLVYLAFLFGRALKMRATRGDDSVEIEAGNSIHRQPPADGS
jgi:hypothetical protein